MLLRLRHLQSVTGLGYTQSLEILMTFLSLVSWPYRPQDLGR
jgi:hypothetical protein